ncbi:MAG: methyltransferase domain-containing protein [Gemmatimonadota bacterium]|nr:MAG: methyltransferase domain-containing protein [Gemmatimonadota bacterium]
MADPDNLIIHTYSEHADDYDERRNLDSCWGRIAQRIVQLISIKARYKVVVDVGCGAGQALRELASRGGSSAQFIGLEPAKKMREHAVQNLAGLTNVSVSDGRFESLPLETSSVDYLFSILAFHWVTDVERAVGELARVLKPDGELDIYFVGRDTGHEFVTKTTPIFIRHLGLGWIVESAKMRKHLTRDGTERLFSGPFPSQRLLVDELRETHYDDLEGHWSWWVSRLSGHFAKMPFEKRAQCDREVRDAIASLATADGIPFEVHLLHVRLRAANGEA